MQGSGVKGGERTSGNFSISEGYSALVWKSSIVRRTPRSVLKGSGADVWGSVVKGVWRIWLCTDPFVLPSSKGFCVTGRRRVSCRNMTASHHNMTQTGRPKHLYPCNNPPPWFGLSHLWCTDKRHNLALLNSSKHMKKGTIRVTGVCRCSLKFPRSGSYLKAWLNRWHLTWCRIYLKQPKTCTV